MNPHGLPRRNLNPVGIYRDAARCSETRISPGYSLHLASFRYSPWTIQGRFPRPLATVAHILGQAALDTTHYWSKLRPVLTRHRPSQGVRAESRSFQGGQAWPPRRVRRNAQLAT